MEILKNIVSQPVFILSGFLISLSSLIMAFSKPRKFVETHLKLPKTNKTFWFIILIIGLPVAFLSVSYRYQILHGILVAEFFIIIALLLSLNQANHENKTSIEKTIHLQQNLEKQKHLVRHIHRLHTTEYKVPYYKITYRINSEGATHTKIAMAIRPTKDTVYFRDINLGLDANMLGPQIIQNLRARNLATGLPLEIIKKSQQSHSLELAIVLNPPATYAIPAEIVVECVRQGLFAPLIANLTDIGSLTIGDSNWSDVDKVEMRIVAPPGLVFESLIISPNLGTTQIDTVGDLSCAIWKANDLLNGRYTYSVRAKKQTE